MRMRAQTHSTQACMNTRMHTYHTHSTQMCAQVHTDAFVHMHMY